MDTGKRCRTGWRGWCEHLLTGLSIFLVLPALLILSSCTLLKNEPGSLLFQDDFSDPGSGWKQGRNASGAVEVAGGSLKISVLSPQTTKITVPGIKFRDTRVEVDARKASGDDDNYFGIVCRYQDDENFYYFMISSDAYYAIGKWSSGVAIPLSAEMMQSSSAIAEGIANNHLRADCVGEELSLYVNGELLSRVEDPEFASGEAGLFAGTIMSSQIEIVFDRFMVLEP